MDLLDFLIIGFIVLLIIRIMVHIALELDKKSKKEKAIKIFIETFSFSSLIQFQAEHNMKFDKMLFWEFEFFKHYVKEFSKNPDLINVINTINQENHGLYWWQNLLLDNYGIELNVRR